MLYFLCDVTRGTDYRPGTVAEVHFAVSDSQDFVRSCRGTTSWKSLQHFVTSQSVVAESCKQRANRDVFSGLVSLRKLVVPSCCPEVQDEK